jgi:formylglycine-generating enzyme required for sulfatase activity
MSAWRYSEFRLRLFRLSKESIAMKKGTVSAILTLIVTVGCRSGGSGSGAPGGIDDAGLDGSTETGVRGSGSGDGATADARAGFDSSQEASSTSDAAEDAPPDAPDAISDASDAGQSIPPSCAPVGPGTSVCGSSNESCCTSLEVTGGTPYYRTYTYGDTSSYADPATVSSFRLDKYLVTVGRFRQFVAAWSGGYASSPSSSPTNGSGKHTHLNGGLGLAQGPNVTSGQAYESGWDATDWNNTTDIDPTTANLECQSPYNTWTSAAESNENLPINCVTWYESYAFCIWDGGFLPSEAEWEYAAAGGGGANGQREYPWGSTAPGTANQYAIYGGYYTGNTTDIAPVGYTSLGAAYWGQFDLAGEVFEWNLDGYNGTYADPCLDCAYLPTTAASGRVIRGDCLGDPSILLPPNRCGSAPTGRDSGFGFRCARTP